MSHDVEESEEDFFEKYTPSPQRDMLTLLVIFTSFDMRAGDEAGGAPPLFAVQTHVDTKWQTMQMGFLALAVLLSQIVMVVHHHQHERQLQADAASSSELQPCRS